MPVTFFQPVLPCVSSTWRVLTLVFAIVVVSTTYAAAGRKYEDQPSVRECLNKPANTNERTVLDVTIKTCTSALRYKNLSAAVRADVLNHRGVAYRNAKLHDKSLLDLRAARILAPNSAQIARMLGWTLREMGRDHEAEQAYDDALRLDPHWQGYLSRCVVRIDQRRFEEALGDCEIAHRMRASEDSVYFLGWLYAEFGRQANAMKVLEAAIAGSNSSGRVYDLLAQVYDAVGRRSDARSLRDKGRRAFPGDPTLSLPAKR